jgi:hypothetical protein
MGGDHRPDDQRRGGVMSCPITTTTHEWLWLRGIECGEPVARYGLCERHAADRDRLGGVGGLSVHLAVVNGEAS